MREIFETNYSVLKTLLSHYDITIKCTWAQRKTPWFKLGNDISNNFCYILSNCVELKQNFRKNFGILWRVSIIQKIAITDACYVIKVIWLFTSLKTKNIVGIHTRLNKASINSAASFMTMLTSFTNHVICSMPTSSMFVVPTAKISESENP